MKKYLNRFVKQLSETQIKLPPWICLLVILTLTSCGVIGFEVGTAIDASHIKDILISGWEMTQIEPGQELKAQHIDNRLSYTLAFLSGYLVAGFGVYWVHRLMHLRKVHVKQHVEHHAKNSGQGWLLEFLEYVQHGSIVILLGSGLWYFSSWIAAVDWALGILLCLLFTAITHEVSHTNPSLIFWTKRPVHYFHHKNHQWKHNFGFTTSFWDRLFGTYKEDLDWKRERVSLRDYLKIKWR